MPIYGYICEKCGSHTEVIQKINDAPLKRCSKCRGKLEKTVSRTSFQLKGSGWYASDYSRKESGSDKETSSAQDTAEKTPAKKSEPAASTAASGDGD